MEITNQHKELVEDLKSVLYPWRKFVITIDGNDGSGKSTLARYLSWKLGMPAIETDLLISTKKPIKYNLEIVKLLIDSRLNIDRPVIVEGIKALDTLHEISVNTDYLIYVNNKSNSGAFGLRQEITEYSEQYNPESKSNYVFTWREE